MAILQDSNLLVVKVPVKPYSVFISDSVETPNTPVSIQTAVVHFRPNDLNSYDAYLSQSTNDGLVVQGISTEVRYSSFKNGLINGEICINERGTAYEGTIIVRDCNTKSIVAESYISDGIFTITDLNPDLKYDIECIPKDPIYTTKIYKAVEPDVYEMDLILELRADTNVIDIGIQYNAIFSIRNSYGTLSVNIIPNEGLRDYTITKISDTIYQLDATLTSKNVKYTLVASDDRSTNVITKTKVIDNTYDIKDIDLSFGSTITDRFSNTNTTIIDPIEYTEFGDSDAPLLDAKDTGSIQIKNAPLLNVGTSPFILTIKFKILSYDSIIPLLTTENSYNTVDNNVFILLMYGNIVKINIQNGNNDSINNSAQRYYPFELNKIYELKIIRNSVNFYVYINDMLLLTHSQFTSKPINFISGGTCYLGRSKWFINELPTSRFAIKSLKLISSGYELYSDTVTKYLKNNILYSMIFEDKIYDSLNNEYSSDLVELDNNRLYKRADAAPIIIRNNYFGFRNIVTLSFEVLTKSVIDKQFIFDSTDISIFIESGKLVYRILNEEYKVNITSDSNNTVTIKHAYDEITIILNTVSTKFNRSKRFISVSFDGATVMSNTYNKNILLGSLKYFYFDSNIYEDLHTGLILNMPEININMALNETYDRQLAKPNNAIGDVVWSIEYGSLPDGITLSPSGHIIGIPLSQSLYIYKLKCTDSVGQAGYAVICTRVGVIASYCKFDGNNNAATMTDMAGKAWLSQNGASLRTANKKFNTSSTFLNGNNQYWYTPRAADITFRGDDFTICMWVYNNVSHTDNKYRAIISCRYNWSNWNLAYSIMRYTSNKYMIEGSSGQETFGAYGGDAGIYRWDFVSFSRTNGMMYIGVNGKITAVVMSADIYDYNDGTAIGRGDFNNGQNFSGYIDDLKIVKGAALYVDEYTPPTKQSDFPANIYKMAPYNVDLSYKKYEGITVKWKHAEYNCTYNVYISDEPIDIANLPQPYLSNITNKECLIEDADLNNSTYYVMVRGIKNNIGINSNIVDINIDHKRYLWSPNPDDVEQWADFDDIDSIIFDDDFRVTGVINKNGKGNDFTTDSLSTAPLYNRSLKCIETLNETNIRLMSMPTTDTSTGILNYTIFIVVKPMHTTGSIQAQGNTGTRYWDVDDQNSPIAQFGTNNGNYVQPLMSITTNAIAMTETRNSYAPYLVSRAHSIGSNKMLVSFNRNDTTKILKSGINGTYANGSYSTVQIVGYNAFYLLNKYRTHNAYCNLHEVIVYTKSLTEDEYTKVEGYLAHKWGLVSALPANHPYKEVYPIADLDVSVENFNGEWDENNNQINLTWELI